jgi:sugar lactone lactonase YvrE
MSLAALSVFSLRSPRVIFSLFVLALASLLLPVAARAQTAHLSSGAQINLGTGLLLPNGVAVDSSGNVFVTDSSHALVKEILAPGYSTTVAIATLNGNFLYPTGIAIDTAGNLFVADGNNGTIKKIAAAGGYVTVSTIATGFDYPAGVAVDREGNVYVADFVSNHLTELLAATSYSIRITIPVSFSALGGVAVDANGNLFTADEYDGIQEIPAAGGYQTLINLASGNQNIVEPYGIALDSSGNLYYTDLALGAAFEIFASSGYQTVVPVLGNLSEPEGVTVDAQGDVFIAQYDNSTVDEVPVTGSAVDFGSVPLGTSTPPTQTLTFEFDSPGKVQAPLALTQGASGEEFKVAGGSCAAATYAAGNTCTVTVSFTPMYAGLRLGALELVNRSGAPFVTIYVSGTGTGAQVAFVPGAQSTLGSGLSAPQGVAADGTGNVFVADTANNAVKEILASGGYAAVRLLGSDFNAPQGVAVDGVGNIFVADTGNNAVEELSATDGYSLVTALGSGFNAPTAVSVDGSGNIYVADTGNNLVKEILAAGGYNTVNTLPSSTTAPSNTEANVNGNLYLADSANNRVLKQDQITPPSLSFATVAVGGGNGAQTVTVQNSGTSALNFSAVSYPANFPESSSAASECTSSTSLTPGQSCTVTVGFWPLAAGPLSGWVVLTDNAQNGTATQQSIAVSGTATQGSQTINFPAITDQVAATTLGLSASSSSGLTVNYQSLTLNVCTVSGTTASLLIKGTCTIEATQSGSSDYTAAPAVQQSFNVHHQTQTISFPAITGPRYVLSQLTLSATASSGLTVAFNSTTPTVCTVAGSTASLLTAGNCVIQANQAGNGAYSVAPQVSQYFKVLPVSQTINFPAITGNQVAATTLGLSATATSSLTVAFASTTPTVCTVSGTTASLLISGACTIQATQPGNTYYGAAPPVSQSFTVHHQTQTIIFPAIGSQVVSANVTLSATASSGLTVSFGTTTPTVCSVAGTTATMLATGNCVIQASQTGNAAYALAPGVSQYFAVKAH